MSLKSASRAGAPRPPVATLLLAAIAVLAFVLPELSAHLELERSRVAAGEWWRLLSGSFSHGSANHLFFDVLAFVVLGCVCERFDVRAFLAAVAASAVAIGAVVLVAHPTLEIYRGLSGVDSALFAMVVVAVARRARAERRPAWALAAAVAGALFVGKTCFEVATGGALFVAGSEKTVAVAHLAGAAIGLAAGAFSRAELRMPASSEASGAGGPSPRGSRCR